MHGESLLVVSSSTAHADDCHSFDRRAQATIRTPDRHTLSHLTIKQG